MTSLVTKRIVGLKHSIAVGVDRRLGTDTEEQVGVEDLGYDEPGLLHYQASSWLTVPLLFRHWHPGPGDVICDLGCGKGRALVQLARRFPVQRIVGLERSPEIAAVAEANLARTAPRRRARAVEVVVGDARTTPLPDDVTIVYVANPFDGEVFAAAMRQVIASYDRRPRPMQIAYVHPTEHERLLATRRVRELPAPGRPWMRLLGVDPSELRRYELLPA